jgi:hypothetical protein
MATVNQETVLPSNLGEANRILSNYGIPQFSEAGFRSAIDEYGANRLKMAIVDLQAGKSGVPAFLKGLVEKHGRLHQGNTNPPENNSRQNETRKEPTRNMGNSNPASQQNQPTPSGEETGKSFEDKESIKIFGGGAAFTIDEDKTQGGFHTIRIEGAKSLGKNKYDWQNKISLQVTRAELPALLAVFLGIIPQVEFKNHGAENNKGYSFENQGDKIFGKVFSPDGVRPLPISPEDCFYLSMITMRQMQKNYPGTSVADIGAMLRSTMILKIKTR